MTSKTLELLRRQAAWQRRRQHLTWEEKIRLAEGVLPGLLAFGRRGEKRKDKDPGDGVTGPCDR